MSNAVKSTSAVIAENKMSAYYKIYKIRKQVNFEEMSYFLNVQKTI